MSDAPPTADTMYTTGPAPAPAPALCWCHDADAYAPPSCAAVTASAIAVSIAQRRAWSELLIVANGTRPARCGHQPAAVNPAPLPTPADVSRVPRFTTQDDLGRAIQPTTAGAPAEQAGDRDRQRKENHVGNRGARADQTVRPGARGRSAEFRGRAWHGDRFPRLQRGRENDHAADAA